MPRKRIISQSELLMVGPSPATGYHFYLVSGSGEASAANHEGGQKVPTDIHGGVVGASLDDFFGYTDFVGVTETLIEQLHRVQNISYDWSRNLTPVRQFGQLARIDNIQTETPTVNLSFSYLLANLNNERLLGFNTTGFASCLTDILNDGKDEKNYFIKTVGEGVDAIGGGLNSNTTDVIGIGNGFITSYSAEASVGGLPSASISVEALNFTFQTGNNNNFIPAVNPTDGSNILDTTSAFASNITYKLPSGEMNPSGIDEDASVIGAISVLRPGDVSFSMFKHGTTNNYDAMGPKIEGGDSKIQSFNLSLGLSRSPIEKLGSRYAFTREIDFPQPVSLTLDVLVDDIRTGSLADIIDCEQEYDILVKFKDPTICDGAAREFVVVYDLRKITLDSMSFSSDLSSNKTATLDFSTEIQGPNQTGVGLFMSGRSINLAG